jgi:hypothetical protein
MKKIMFFAMMTAVLVILNGCGSSGDGNNSIVAPEKGLKLSFDFNKQLPKVVTADIVSEIPTDVTSILVTVLTDKNEIVDVVKLMVNNGTVNNKLMINDGQYKLEAIALNANYDHIFAGTVTTDVTNGYGNATIVLEPDKSYFVVATEVDTVKMADFSLNVGDEMVLPVAVNTSFQFNGFVISLTYDPAMIEVLQVLPSSNASAFKGMIAGAPNANITFGNNDPRDLLMLTNSNLGLKTATLVGVSLNAVGGKVILGAIKVKAKVKGNTVITIRPFGQEFVYNSLNQKDLPTVTVIGKIQ